MMSKMIHKTEIYLRAHQYELPHEARIVHFGVDPRNNLCIWYEFVPQRPKIVSDRLLHVFGTRCDIPLGLVHVGTTVQGDSVWHLYEGEIPSGFYEDRLPGISDL